MSEENEEYSAESGAAATLDQTGTPDPIEQRITDIATAAGWKATGPLSAEEFLRTMPDRFKAKGTELRELQKSVKAIQATFAKATAAQYERGLQDKQAEMDAARAAYDFDRYEKARSEHEQIRQLQQAEIAAPEILPEVDEFIKRNPWFDTDKSMTADALMYKENYLKTNPGAAAADVLAYVEKKIKKDYPEEFKTGQKDEPDTKPGAGVETGRNSSANVPQWQRDSKLLTPLERDMMKTMCGEMRNGKPVMTEEKYINSLRAQGAFDGRK